MGRGVFGARGSAAIGVIALCGLTVTVVFSVARPGVAATMWRAAPLASSPTPPPCGGWECELQARFAATAEFIDQEPGYLGIVVRDRMTDQVWQAGAADRPIWTASTIKLAIIADLLVRARAGEVRITSSMRDGFDDMLSVSANRPATNLWATYGGEDALERYRSVFGMSGIHFPTGERRWGAVRATALDFAALMSYVLDTMDPEDRQYIVDSMRNVHEVQQWGVWAAGPDQQPGVKDGWNVEKTPDGLNHWVVNSVGFAGPLERYVVVVMYELLPGTHVAGNGLADGLHAVSDVVATLFGAAVPASVPGTDLVLNPPT